MVTNATVAHAKIRMLESSTNRLKRQIAAEEVNVDKLSADERLAAEVQLNAKKETTRHRNLRSLRQRTPQR